MKSNKYGNILISGDVYDNKAASTALFKYLGLIPYRVEHIGYRDIYDILGTSHRFEELEDGLIAPIYNIETTFNEDTGDFEFRVYK